LLVVGGFLDVVAVYERGQHGKYCEGIVGVETACDHAEVVLPDDEGFVLLEVKGFFEVQALFAVLFCKKLT
jgi:hypothetical protein